MTAYLENYSGADDLSHTQFLDMMPHTSTVLCVSKSPALYGFADKSQVFAEIVTEKMTP